MGLFYRKKFKDEAEIAIWELTETEQELAKYCSLPNDEAEELSYITAPQRRLEKLAVRALLDVLFGEKVYLRYHDNGRPFLQNSITEISISHTKRFVCVLTHPEYSVGVDMECMNRSFAAVEARVLHEEEKEFLSDRPETRQHQLGIIWCAKEALYKYLSINEVDFARQMEVKRFTPHEEDDLEITFTYKDGEEETFELQYTTIADHYLVWLVA